MALKILFDVKTNIPSMTNMQSADTAPTPGNSKDHLCASKNRHSCMPCHVQININESLHLCGGQHKTILQTACDKSELSVSKVATARARTDVVLIEETEQYESDKENNFAPTIPTDLENEISALSLSERSEQYRPKKKDNCDLKIPKDIEEELQLLISSIDPKKNTDISYTEKSNTISDTCINDTEEANIDSPDCNIKWDKSFFDIDEELSFNDLESKFQIVQSINLSLSLRHGRQCLICNVKIQNSVHYFYAHVRSLKHQIALSELNAAHGKWTLTQTFSDLELLEQSIVQNSDGSLKCMICNISINNNDNAIRTHLREMRHEYTNIIWKQEIKIFTDNVFEELKQCCYSIQWYSCVLCKLRFQLKACFIKHVVQTHLHDLETIPYLAFDCCIPCATAWLGTKGTYYEHCEFRVHQRLLKNNDFDCTDLSKYAKEFLNCAEENADKVLASSTITSTEKRDQDILQQALENTVRSRYPQCKIYPFGSRHAGLSQPDSDNNIYIDCVNESLIVLHPVNSAFSTENGYDGQSSQEVTLKHVQDVSQALCESNQFWKMKILIEPTVAIIKVLHRPTGIACDLSFTDGFAVENTKLLRAYTEAYSPCRQLILFLRHWLSLCSLNGPDGISNYALALIVIFYLQKTSILPSVTTMFKESRERNYISGWKTCGTYDVHIDPQHQNKSFQELLVGFFKYYADFDYRKNIICPLIGEPIPKIRFTDTVFLVKEMSPYLRHVDTTKNPQYFRLDSAMCVQDPITLNMNKTKAVSNLMLKAFRKCCLKSAEHLNSVKQTKATTKI